MRDLHEKGKMQPNNTESTQSQEAKYAMCLVERMRRHCAGVGIARICAPYGYEVQKVREGEGAITYHLSKK